MRMDDQELHEMPEWKRLSDYEQTIIIRRMMRVYAAHRHPERGVRIGEIIDKIKRELKAGQRIQ